ncbi:dehydrogenase [Adhaeribacter arboris]|uniref:Dehydrogenase n=1 Tax=Adhaeribacter arboris TaxID=2072846 RepID=A0A2T2YK10_9BACT|nr:PVC-type heme-binding CxxCH protein [Adhaeribacter arboris]PSR55838.1 dehydrogenase [Adhaeribacter arboris]
MKIRYSYPPLPWLVYLLIALWGGTILQCKQQNNAAPTGGVPPEKALSTFELEPGFKIELVAAEPLVADPVAMEIDENGRMYVVEMHGYPLDKSGSGKIKLLTDTNGDGRMDKSTTFAEGLMLPTGIMRWKKGVLVTDPPTVLYLEDTDGDNQADVKKTVLTGFAVSNPQHNLNNPLLGLDNWIYVGHESAVTAKIYQDEFGDAGKDILYPDKPNGPRLINNASGRSVRFRPDEYALEITSGDTQFGHTFDTWGRHFLVSNANHIFQEVIAEPYLRRNPDLLVTDATQSLSDHENAAEVFPITKNPENQLLTDVGVITSACAITSYQGGAFPEDFNSNVTFVAEPVSNLVHVDRLKPKGASFTASRLRPHKEFLASTDAWFRPVNMYTGPDGALYLVDYYRQIIEHPEWMAEDVVKSGALYNGTDKGRIYRISAADAKPVAWTKELNLGNATDEQLVAKLAEPNIWWRRNAQRLLVDRKSEKVIPALRQMAQNKAAALGRLHALWTLEGMHQLSPDLIIQALQDSEPGIRENAIKLAELHLKEAPDLAAKLLSLQNDSDAKVRYQLLCTLGFINTPQVNQVRQQILFKDLADEWIQVAALSASSGQNAALLEAVLAQYKPGNPAYASLVQRLSALVGARQEPQAIRQLLQKATTTIAEGQEAWRAPVLMGLAQGLKNRKSLPAELQTARNILIQTCLEHPSASVREGALKILQVTKLPAGTLTQKARQQAQQIAKNKKLPEDQRALAVEFLALANPKPYTTFLTNIINPREPLPVQLAALHTLSVIPDLTVSRYVMQKWSTLTPEIRDAAINTFMKNPQRISLLLDALETNKIQAATIGWPRSVSLMAQEDEKLRNRARALLTKKENKRQEVIQEYQTALNLQGDRVQGKAVFQGNCSVCHQMRGSQGVAFGPDLGTVHNWQPAGIMTNILDPNQSISDGYDMWEVALINGKSIQGIIATESPNALTLRNAGGQVTTIARPDIKALKALGLSAMPTGLEKKINQQQMADLLAYLRQVD